MQNVRQVHLELLRHGPPHNQLLSPLTSYMALSGRHRASAVHFPYEHWELLRELGVLRYSARKDQGPQLKSAPPMELALVGAKIGSVLGQVPGLGGSLSKAVCNDELVQLRLVFSAAELALVPFELAVGATGFPGEGRELSLQLDAPLVMTREVRYATGNCQTWPRQPRVLFVSAAPAGYGPVQANEHLQVLVKALEPWTGQYIPQLADSDRKYTKKYLTYLKNASLEQIRQACQDGKYTHVHILAHGDVIEQDSGQHGFALVLHKSPGDSDRDLVSAKRLEAALRANQSSSTWELSHPAVISLATCDSGNQAQVITPATSLAHTLHEAGVPLVVASQFPLSMGGALALTDTLYTGLLAGEDPRWVLHAARRRLRARDSRTHDWASMVAYTSLPEDLEQQLQETSYAKADSGIKVANRQATHLIEYLKDNPKEKSDVVLKALDKADEAAKAMPLEGGFMVEGQGCIASKDKRKAQLLFETARELKKKKDSSKRDVYLSQSHDALALALDGYWLASTLPFESAPRLHWVLVQWQSLNAVLGRKDRPGEWCAAHFSATLCANSAKEELWRWAFGSLAELYLLQLVLDVELPGQDREEASQNARDCTQRLLDLNGRGSAEVVSTWRQFDRYITWWGSRAFSDFLSKHKGIHRHGAWDAEGGALLELARELCKMLQ